ncbi:Asp/Glu racemase [Alisedimentitalea sp. MJ-SS2]|uniref:maleate cis-trans isomerase family protein n=1 Tax=Aliisedimentitalea sp. MJ-SS2 TaxID=3049795 RepID=UPI00290C9218|nr:Asp/Glu racemase [Alisedimentitalea sp. MJ-SS2]MDU8926480.1 Asp/Glu racemase [Alisedimentitalea sp. MJ-SS2]
MTLTYSLDRGYGGQGRLGLIVLSTDETLENEARQILAGQPVSLLHARIPAQAEVTPEALKTMEDHMVGTASLLPQGMDVVGYGCTSGATVIGPDRVADLICQVQGEAAVTNPLSAVIASLQALRSRRIALLTPYVESVNAPLVTALRAEGIEVLTQASFNQSDDWSVARIAEADTLAAIETLGKTEGCDAVFASCTNLRVLGVLEQAEAATGLPVISSNLALIWHMLRLGGIDAKGWAPGRLFGV